MCFHTTGSTPYTVVLCRRDRMGKGPTLVRLMKMIIYSLRKLVYVLSEIKCTVWAERGRAECLKKFALCWYTRARVPDTYAHITD